MDILPSTNFAQKMPKPTVERTAGAVYDRAYGIFRQRFDFLCKTPDVEIFDGPHAALRNRDNIIAALA
jgi:hypothetical protein